MSKIILIPHNGLDKNSPLNKFVDPNHSPIRMTNFENYNTSSIFGIGWDRYCQFGNSEFSHAFVAVVSPEGKFDADEVAPELDAGDIDASFAADKIKEAVKQGKAFIGYHNDPVEALKIAMDKLRDWYNN